MWGWGEKEEFEPRGLSWAFPVPPLSRQSWAGAPAEPGTCRGHCQGTVNRAEKQQGAPRSCEKETKSCPTCSKGDNTEAG